MLKNTHKESFRLDLILRDLITERAFGEMEFIEALTFFCKALARALDAPRVGVWDLVSGGDAIRCRVQYDRNNGVSFVEHVLTDADAATYLAAVRGDLAVVINDAATDPRCVELARSYLPATGVSALLDCPIRTFAGLAGVVCIESVGQRRDWTPDEVSFAQAVTGLVALTIEHNDRVAAQRTARDRDERLKVYTELATDRYWEADPDFTFRTLQGNTVHGGVLPSDFVGLKLWEAPGVEPVDSTWDELQERIEERRAIRNFVISSEGVGGARFFFELAGVPRFADDGFFLGYRGIARDVTERIRQEQELSNSEKRYRNAARMAKLGAWIWDEVEDKCTYCSPELAEMHNVSVEEFLARATTVEDDLQWVHPDDRDRYRQVIAQAVENRTGYEITARTVLDDGRILTLQETTEAVFDRSGKFVATVGVLQDLTDQVEMAARLQEHQDRLATIVDNIPGAVYRVRNDANFTPIYLSRGHAPMFVDPNLASADPDAAEACLSVNFAPGERSRVDEALRRSVALDQPYEIEYTVVLADGSQRRVADRGRPIRVETGEIELEGIMTDVTARHEAQEALALAQRLESIGKLTGGIAHDFNNLLAVVLGNLELLREEITSSSQLAFLDSGIEAVLRGADLTKNMLAFARKTSLNEEVLNLNDLACKAQTWIGRTLPENILVETSLMAGLWKVEADASGTESALLNLMINARDAMPSGGRLTVETSNLRIDEDYVETRHENIPSGRYVMLAVSDTGHGISKDMLNQIFEPFFTTKPPGAGSGLGLSMIQGFMKQSGGTVRVYSEPGVGTTFKLYFRALTEDRPTTVRQVAAAAVDPPSGARILVVEDEPGLLEVLQANLTRAGYDICSASTGDAALQIFAEEGPFDLVITDIVMPGTLQGTELAVRLREQEPELRVIYMSGYASEATVHGNGLRPEDVRLMKPIRRTDLIRAVEKVLG